MTRQEELLAAASSLKIVRGSVNEQELAALVASVAAMASSAEEEVPGAPTSSWMDRTRTMSGSRLMLPFSRGDAAWRNALR